MSKQSNNKVTKEEQIKYLVDNGYEPQDCIMSGTLLGCVGLTLLDYLDNTYYEISKEEIQNYINNQQKQQPTKEEQVQSDNTTSGTDSVGSIENQKKSWYDLGQRPPIGETVILQRNGYTDCVVKIKVFSETIFIYAPTEGMDMGTEFSSYIKGCAFRPLPVKTKDEQTIDELTEFLKNAEIKNFDYSSVATEIFNKFIKAPKD